MTHVFHRNPRQTLPVAVGGQGIELIDSTGKRYLDACGGAAVSCLGHGHPRVIEAMQRQAAQLAYAHTSFFTTEVAEALADTLAASAPGDLNHVYFVSGGSEGVEAALKLARQYFVEIGQPQRQYFIARRQSYHGNTLGALAIGGNAWRREPFLPLLVPAHHVSPCFAYRERFEGETDDAYVQRLADELEAKILELGDDKVIAFVRSLSPPNAQDTKKDIDPAKVAAGKELFAANCASCHGEDAKGNRDMGAPDLADAIWLKGSGEDAIVRQVSSPRHGVMPAWGARLGDTTVKQLTIFVHSLGGGE